MASKRNRKINPELAAMRAEVARKQRNAAAKIRRIEKTTGAVLGASPADPRVNAAKLARYTAKQLQAYSSRLDAFTHRSNQFVAGVGGVPLPRKKWEEYKALEAANNAMAKSRIDEHGNIKLPGSDTTIAMREREIISRSARAQGGLAANKPHTYVERTPNNINGIEGLDKLIMDMRRKQKRQYIPAKIKAGREELDKMLKIIGNDALRDRARNLTDNQFDILWHESMAAMDASLLYELTKRNAVGIKDRSDIRQIEDNLDELSELFEWAGNLPAERVASGNQESARKLRR